MSRSPIWVPLYCIITLGKIWLGYCISNHLLKTEEGEDVNKHVYPLLSNSEPLNNMVINFEGTPARPIGSLALARGVT